VEEFIERAAANSDRLPYAASQVNFEMIRDEPDDLATLK